MGSGAHNGFFSQDQEDAGHRPVPTRLLQYAEPGASLHLRRSLDPRVRVGGGRKIDAPGKLPGDLLGNECQLTRKPTRRLHDALPRACSAVSWPRPLSGPRKSALWATSGIIPPEKWDLWLVVQGGPDIRGARVRVQPSQSAAMRQRLIHVWRSKSRWLCNQYRECGGQEGFVALKILY